MNVRVGTEEKVTLSARRLGHDFLVFFAGANTRDGVARLTNQEVALPRSALPPPGPGEVYVQDLVGCEVVDLDRVPRGVVRSVVWNGAHDVLMVQDGSGEPLLIPAVPEFLREVDLAARRLVVDPHE